MKQKCCTGFREKNKITAMDEILFQTLVSLLLRQCKSQIPLPHDPRTGNWKEIIR